MYSGGSDGDQGQGTPCKINRMKMVDGVVAVVMGTRRCETCLSEVGRNVYLESA
jgi:hypothetical protein